MSTAAETASGLRHQLTEHLRRLGLIDADQQIEVTPLAGGVSNDVVAVSGGGLEVVVKRALSQLRVESDWRADPARLSAEGRALRLANELSPGSAPRVIDLSDGFLIMERAPQTWTDWRTLLLAGAVDPRISARLGELLGQLQHQTAHMSALRGAFGDVSVFRQLRVDPFHLTVAARHPDLRDEIMTAVHEMTSRKDCLVHGDFSPKNILTATRAPTAGAFGRELWLIDWEVAHVGDASFDPAFLITHLLLKSVHLPALADAYEECARTFLAAFGAAGGVPVDAARLSRQVGCLLLARVDGKSPADYLTDEERDRVRQLGRNILLSPLPDAAIAWRRLNDVID